MITKYSSAAEMSWHSNFVHQMFGLDPKKWYIIVILIAILILIHIAVIISVKIMTKLSFLAILCNLIPNL